MFPPPVEPAPPPAAGPAARPGVLVACPATRTRTLLADFLAARGFAVWTADGGVPAFDVYVRHPGRIEVVVADADLPDLPEMGFVGRFHRHFPGVPVCVLADDPFGPLAGEMAAAGAVVVSKPVHLRQLAEIIRGQLAAAW